MSVTSSAQKQLQNFEIQCTIGRKGKKSQHLGCPPHPSDNITRKIRDHDPEIVVWFNRVLSRWMLFRRGHTIMTVQNSDRSYRPLDHRALVALRAGDTQQRGTAFLDEIISHNEKLEARNDANFDAYVKDTSDHFRKKFRDHIDTEVGALNVPKEDLVVPDVDTLKKQRQSRTPFGSKKAHAVGELV